MNSVQICNAALSYLGNIGNVVTIEPPDGSPYSESCSIYYPQALLYLLESHDWCFATRRIRVPKLSSFDEEMYGWRYGFTVPSDMVRVIGVYGKTHNMDEGSAEFQIESLENNAYILLTNVENPILRYVARVSDASRFPNYFVQALILQTASYLAGPLMKTSLAEKMMQLASQALENAKYQDCRNSIRLKREYLAPHLKARSI